MARRGDAWDGGPRLLPWLGSGWLPVGGGHLLEVVARAGVQHVERWGSDKFLGVVLRRTGEKVSPVIAQGSEVQIGLYRVL